MNWHSVTEETLELWAGAQRAEEQIAAFCPLSSDLAGSRSGRKSAPLCQSPGEPHLGPEADGYVDWINSQGPLEPPLRVKGEATDDLVGWRVL